MILRLQTTSLSKSHIQTLLFTNSKTPLFTNTDTFTCEQLTRYMTRLL